MGCHWLEMDVVVTGDGHVLVSHEPWIDHATCVGPEGRPLTAQEGRSLNLYRMPLQEIQRYHTLPPNGPHAPTAPKPLLAEVVAAVDQLARAEGIPPVRFNIEIKSDPALYGSFQPLPGALARRVLQEIRALSIDHRCLVQCFDPAVLQAMHGLAPAIPSAMLVEQPFNVEDGLQVLGFKPAYCSPAFHLVDQKLVDELRENGIGLLTWTVNAGQDMERMIRLGVDGLITDRPAEAMALLAQLQ